MRLRTRRQRVGTKAIAMLTATAIVGGYIVTTVGASGPGHSPAGTPFLEIGDAPGEASIVDGGADGPVGGVGDWQELHMDTEGSGVATAFLEDQLSVASETDDTVFSGSNKNNDPISDADCAPGDACDDWQWQSGKGSNVPAKDDISNAYAHAAVNSHGELLLFAGVERIVSNGDSHIDLEFLQGGIAVHDGTAVVPSGTDPVCGVATCDFVGARQAGDIIVSMDYTKGGDFGTLDVRTWNPATGQYEEKVLAGEGCKVFDPLDVSEEPSICVTNNGGLIPASSEWSSYDGKAKPITQLPRNAFTEFGINLTRVLGLDASEQFPCLSTFIAKSRSSASFTAELKDFAGPADFDVCSGSVELFNSGTNEVGDDHTFYAYAAREFGDGNTSGARWNSSIDVTLTTANGAAVADLVDTCDADGLGAAPADMPADYLSGRDSDYGWCTVTFTSNSTGVITANAEATIDFGGGHTVTESTDGTGSNSGPVKKRFVDAGLEITGSATNETGQAHTFTVYGWVDRGDGDGQVAVPDDTDITITLTPEDGLVLGDIDDVDADCDVAPSLYTATSEDSLTAGECEVTFNSDVAGDVLGSAVMSLTIPATTIDGVSVPALDLDRDASDEDAAADSDGDAEDEAVTKHYVDAYIEIAPDATNSIGQPHTFTVTVKQDTGTDDGVAGGFAPAPAGTDVDVTLTRTGIVAADFTLVEDTCDTDSGGAGLDANGTCTVTFVADDAGSVEGSASVSLTLEGKTVTRSTDGIGNNSGTATKTYVEGSLRWLKHDNDDGLLAGATFQVCRTHDLEGDDPGQLVEREDASGSPDPACFSVSDGSSPDTDATGGEFQVGDLPLGTYTIRETAAPTGWAETNTVQYVTIDFDDPTGVAADPFVNDRPIVKLTEFGYVNSPDGANPAGVVKGVTTWTAEFENYGGAATVLTGSIAVTGTAGDLVCDGDGDGTFDASDNVIDFGTTTLSEAGGADDTASFSITCKYDTEAGTEITADLDANYETNDLDRTPSGAPASVTFTVQGNDN